MKKRYLILTIAMAAAAVVCSVLGIRQYIQEKDAGSRYDEIREEAKQEPSEKPEKDPVQIPIDFAALKERNPDIYAWITIPDTAVDYPVVQSEADNTWYLTHTIDGTESPEGAIFTETYNSRDFEDPNTVIYGHDMANGSMFQNLLNYQDRSYFDSHRDVTIYTPDSIRHYRIFAAYLYDDRHLMQSFDFENRAVYQDYLNQIFSVRNMNSCVDTEQKVSAEDRILTLSTCYGTQADARYLVQAVLVSIEQ